MADPVAQAATAAAASQDGELSESERAIRREQAIGAARACPWRSGVNPSSRPRPLYRTLRARLNALEAQVEALRDRELSDDLRWLVDNFRLIHTDLEAVHDALRPLSRLPGVRTSEEESIPRVLVLARSLLHAANDRIEQSILTDFIVAIEEIEPLRIDELNALLDGMKIALLEALADRGPKARGSISCERRACPQLRDRPPDYQFARGWRA